MTKRPLTSSIVNRVRPSGIRKFFDVPPGGISLGVGEPDFVTPEHIRRAAIASIEAGKTHYTSNYGILELRQRISAEMQRLYGIEYDPADEVLVTVGGSEAIDIAVRAILEHGDGVLLPEPGYVSYAACASLAGGVIQTVPTHAERGFSLTASEVEAVITPQTRAIVMGFPNNPTGAVLEPDEAQKIVDLCVEHDLLIVSDEIYHRLVYGRPHVCMAALRGARERTILVSGFSKAYAMTGWRLGFACAPAEVIEAMMKIHQYVIMSAPTAAQYAGIEALDHGEADVEAMLREYDRRRRRVVSGLNEIGLRCLEPKGAFYAFPSIAITGMSSDEFSNRLFDEEKVAVVPGTAFGDQGEGHVRICYATAYELLEEALVRMKRFVERHSLAPASAGSA